MSLDPVIRQLAPPEERVWKDMPPAARMRAARIVSRVLLLSISLVAFPSRAAILWTDPGAILINNSGPGRDVLNGSLKRDDSSNDTLYFKFHVAPVSDSTTEEYFAAFELFEGDAERLGIGNALKAWAYSAFFGPEDVESGSPGTSYVDLHSAAEDASGSAGMAKYELPRRGAERTIIFKVQYVPGGDDLVTVWLNPDLSPGANEIHQPDALTTRFSANAAFDEIRLRHGGRGGGWFFSDLAIASSFTDFVDPSSSMARMADPGSLFNAQRFSVETWLREPGMPRTTIRALVQTADGYLWLAGDDRLARFDGVRFVPLDVKSLTGTNTIQTLFGDSRGSLWIGTAEGSLVRYSNGRVETYTAKEGLPSGSINALTEAADGAVWIGTTAGLTAWRDGAIRKIGGAERLGGSEIKSLYCDLSGIIWIGVAGEGVFRYEQRVLSQLSDPRVDELLRDPHSLLMDSTGRLWIFTTDGFVLCRDRTDWRRYRVPSQPGIPHGRLLAAESDGSIWAGSAVEGLVQIKDGKLAALNSTAGLADRQVSALLRDRNGNLWVGGGSGLHFLKPKRHFTLGQTDGLSHGTVGAIAEVAPGVIWALQPGRGLYRWEGGAFRHLTAAGFASDDMTLGAMLVTRDGGCWIACTNGLILFRSPQAVADESLFFELPQATITALAEDPDESIWAGTWQGQLWRLQQGRWRLCAQLDSSAPVAALAIESSGLVWLGTDGAGLYLIDEAGHTRFHSGESLSGKSVQALHRDSSARVWIGTEKGLVAGRLENQTPAFSTIAGLPDMNILEFLQDSVGRLWLNDGAGLTCISKPSPSGGPAIVAGTYPMAVSGSGQSASDSDIPKVYPKGCKTSSGRLWFGTFNGLFVVEPESESHTNAFAIILEEVLVDGIPAPSFKPITAAPFRPVIRSDETARLRIGPGKHRVEVHYTSPKFGATEPVRFQYRMEELDRDWVDAGSARKAVYNYLPPGNYRFVVSAGGVNGASTQAGIELSVSPYPWQRSWVIGLALMSLVLAIVSGARLAEKRRMNRQLRRLQEENALERERTRIAQDLHDEMGAKLCRISFLSEHAGRLDPSSGEIRRQIATIAEDSRQLLHSLDEIVWVVNPRNDTLEHVVSYIGQYAQDYLSGTGIQCELDISRELPHLPVSSQTRHQLFLAANEAFTNVLKHSGASQVNLAISCADHTLTIQVKDNGRGFSTPVSAVKTSGNGEPGNGLTNMHERLGRMGGECRVNSTPGQGTTVQFRLEITNSTRKDGAS